MRQQNTASAQKLNRAPADDEEQTGKDTALEILHGALDAAGMIPALGIVPDAINTGIYLIEGDWTNAGFAAAAMVPVFGQGATATKYGVKVSRETIKRVGREGIERGFKELAQHTISRRARAIRNLTEDLLLKMEGFKNGHLLTRDSGKSVNYLKRRLVNEPRLEFATTFYNTAIATKAVRQNLSHNADDISKWLADKRNPIFISKFEHSFPVGEGFKKGTKKLRKMLKTSKIVLYKDSSVDIGFRIQTGFPVID